MFSSVEEEAQARLPRPGVGRVVGGSPVLALGCGVLVLFLGVSWMERAARRPGPTGLGEDPASGRGRRPVCDGCSCGVLVLPWGADGLWLSFLFLAEALECLTCGACRPLLREDGVW